ncbi:MAG TPA: hydroxymethylglutaryl-CoA lyase [Solirubrobacteraceae bacterium]
MIATGSVELGKAAEYRRAGGLRSHVAQAQLSGSRATTATRIVAMAATPEQSTPSAVRIREVGPRDGFQNEPEVIATERKVELIDALARTGLRRLEVTSFVRADVIPQLADAGEVLARIDVPEQVALSVLIPNERGLDAALAARERKTSGRPAFEEVNVFLSASETHNRNNVNRSIAESLAGVEAVLRRARAEGLRCEGVISTSFGCPYEGHVPPARVLEIAARLIEAGAQEIGFGDTTGMANPRQVREFFGQARTALPGAELTAHFHNTRGQGLANALAALEAGVDSFESSFGELGGCPVPAGATGNIATEDLVSMLDEMGVRMGIDLAALLACSRRAQEILGRPLGSHTLVAGPVEWHAAPQR